MADDDPDERELFSEALACVDPSIICQGVENGKQALSVLSISLCYPSIIFSDINMPVMNGWELLKRLKGDYLYTNIPVVIYSTSSMFRDRQIARDLGASCFITKPPSFRKVKEMLSIVITNLNNGSLQEMCEQVYRALQQ